MRTILFVDDEPNVLAGLRNSLRSRRSVWDCVFVSSPELALAQLEERPFDVVISDMRMPTIDGVAVLEATKRIQPRAVRMILSGQTQMDAVMRSVFVAHVFLAKPCSTEHLQDVVERSCHLLSLLERDDVKTTVGGIGMLPAAPRIYVELTEELGREGSTISNMTAIIERDPALAAKLLHLSNSAFFGLPRRILSLREAVTYLGTTTLKSLALALESFSRSMCPSLPQHDLDALARFSLRVARIARFLAGADKRNADEAFVAGLLHALGRLLPTSRVALSDVDGPDWPLWGAYLLGLWGFPYPIIEAIAHHQRPGLLRHERFELVDMLHVAHHLAGMPKEGRIPSELDCVHLRSIGFDDGKLNEVMGQIQAYALDDTTPLPSFRENAA